MRRVAWTLAATLLGATLGITACGADNQTALGDLEDCVNGVDDNGDGVADCLDPQCTGHAACLSQREFLCDNGVDDDGDNRVDCEDTDCLQTSACDPTREWNCVDGVDNDLDGLKDCLDPDCEQACMERCADGEDNDGDGDVDCDDDDCLDAPACQGGPACLPGQPLSCAETVVSNTAEGEDNYASYPCNSGPFGGPERFFHYTAPREMILDIWLSDHDGNGLTMIASGGDPALGCNLDELCYNELTPGYMPVQVGAGATLYLIVDGTTSSGGAFDLWMDCTPTTEDGLCFDNEDNDLDGWWDCEDIDCATEPSCDFWVSAGWPCDDTYECPAEEFCENVTLDNGTSVGFCTRLCSNPGTAGGECATEGYGDGLCTGFNGSGGPRCLLPCEAGDSCPPLSVCTDIVSGSVSSLNDSYCLPFQ